MRRRKVFLPLRTPDRSALPFFPSKTYLLCLLPSNAGPFFLAQRPTQTAQGVFLRHSVSSFLQDGTCRILYLHLHLYSLYKIKQLQLINRKNTDNNPLYFLCFILFVFSSFSTRDNKDI